MFSIVYFTQRRLSLAPRIHYPGHLYTRLPLKEEAKEHLPLSLPLNSPLDPAADGRAPGRLPQWPAPRYHGSRSQEPGVRFIPGPAAHELRPALCSPWPQEQVEPPQRHHGPRRPEAGQLLGEDAAQLPGQWVNTWFCLFNFFCFNLVERVTSRGRTWRYTVCVRPMTSAL